MTSLIASPTETSLYSTPKRAQLCRESSVVPAPRSHQEVPDRFTKKPCAKVLLIDEDACMIAEALRVQLPILDCRIESAHTGEKALHQLRAEVPDVILLGWKLADQAGKEMYRQIRQINAHVPIITMIAGNRADTAIEAMQNGAYDCLFKPLDLHQLRSVVGDALDVAAQMRQPSATTAPPPDVKLDEAIIGNCAAMREVYKAIGRVTDQDVTVLITGESGTGKELVARAIYHHSHRANGPFLALNCAAMPEHLLESELFGHEKGAFTGAEHRRIGKFEQCHGGTIFLDEIGDMPLAIQAKMLRVLQEQSFQRVGGNETIHTNVRLIAATHHDLKQDAAEGKFRSDLYYRMGGFTIDLPPLRERGDDLPALIRYFLQHCSRELGREVQEIAPEAVELLRRYSWPGNVRELKSVVKQAVLRTYGAFLVPAFLPVLPGITNAIPRNLPAAVDDGNLELLLGRSQSSDHPDLYAEAHRGLDRRLLTRVLDDVGGNQHQAARRLGIARETLRRRLRELGLHVTRQALSVDPI